MTDSRLVMCKCTDGGTSHSGCIAVEVKHRDLVRLALMQLQKSGLYFSAVPRHHSGHGGERVGKDPVVGVTEHEYLWSKSWQNP